MLGVGLDVGPVGCVVRNEDIYEEGGTDEQQHTNQQVNNELLKRRRK